MPGAKTLALCLLSLAAAPAAAAAADDGRGPAGAPQDECAAGGPQCHVDLVQKRALAVAPKASEAPTAPRVGAGDDEPCAPGTFIADFSTFACEDCPSGKYTGGQDMTECMACGVGGPADQCGNTFGAARPEGPPCPAGYNHVPSHDVVQPFDQNMQRVADAAACAALCDENAWCSAFEWNPSKSKCGLGSVEVGNAQGSKWTSCEKVLAPEPAEPEPLAGTSGGGLIFKRHANGEGGWSRIGGVLKQISTGYRHAWGVSAGDELWRCALPCNGQWHKVDGNLAQLDVGVHGVYGVTSTGEVFTRGEDGSGGWSKVGGILKHISLPATSGGYAWGINSAGEIWRCGLPCSGNWQRVDGILDQLDVGAHEVYGVTSSGEVFRRPSNGSGQWLKVGGQLKHVSVGSINVWGVSTGGEIWKCGLPCDGNWQKVDGQLEQLDAGGVEVYGVTR